MNGATFSPCGLFRYRLWRELTPMPKRKQGRSILWVMLNPSTADCTVNDPTILNCMYFSKTWGFDWMDVVNLFAFRATDPRELNGMPSSFFIGPKNDEYIANTASDADMIVCAWGANKHAPARAAHVVGNLLRPFMPLHCLATCANGQPGHPLYKPHHLLPTEWKLYA